MILWAWRSPAGWAAGGGTCPSISPTSTPTVSWDKRAPYAKVRPQRVCLTYSDIADKGRHTCFQGAPVIFPSLALNASKQTQAKTQLLIHMYNRHQFCKYMHITLENDTLVRQHAPTHMSAIQAKMSLCHIHISTPTERYLVFAGFLFLTGVTSM